MRRASEAAARAFWPLGNTRLEKRLGLIAAPTLILWGDRDAVLPPSYAKKFAAGINGSTRVETVAEAGHLVGKPGEGWKVAMGLLEFERGVSTLGQQMHFAYEFDLVVKAAQANGSAGAVSCFAVAGEIVINAASKWRSVSAREHWSRSGVSTARTG